MLNNREWRKYLALAYNFWSSNTQICVFKNKCASIDIKTQVEKKNSSPSKKEPTTKTQKNPKTPTQTNNNKTNQLNKKNPTTQNNPRK